jgi:hypothetical protein
MKMKMMMVDNDTMTTVMQQWTMTPSLGKQSSSNQ